MSFSTEWEERYSANTHLSVWPWSDIVSLVHRHCKPVIDAGGGVCLSSAVVQVPIFLYLEPSAWTITE